MVVTAAQPFTCESGRVYPPFFVRSIDTRLFLWFNPRHVFTYWTIAQSVEHDTFNVGVVGSNPTGPTNFIERKPLNSNMLSGFYFMLGVRVVNFSGPFCYYTGKCLYLLSMEVS